MRWEHYDGIVFYDDKLEYRFISEGPKGKIIKVVRFLETGNFDIYNLAFGNLNKDGSIDDETINDNKDRDKIIGTIRVIIYDFTSFNPGKLVFFGGSTPARTRLFRIILSGNIESFEKDFHVYSVSSEKNKLIKRAFKKNIDCVGFIIKKKRRKLII